MNPYRSHPGERGQAIILMVAVMVVLLGFAGLAIDGGNLYSRRRHAQNAADNAALAYALAIQQSQSTTAETKALAVLTANGYVDGQGDVTITINHPPAGYDSSYVEVLISGRIPTMFIHLVYGGPAAYTVQAISHGEAGTVTMEGFAIVSIMDCTQVNNQNNVGISGGGNSGGVNVHNGSIFVNSPETGSDPCALNPPNSSGNDGITVDSGFEIVSVGSYNYSGNSDISPSPITTGYNGGTPVDDPLASLEEPTCPSDGTVNTASNPDMYSPGNWEGRDMLEGTYQPGIYCIHSSDISISGSQTIVGSGVVFYFIDHGLQITGGAGITLIAPNDNGAPGCLGTPGDTSATCQFPGIVIYARRGNTSTIDVRGNGGNAVTGTIYAPDATIQAKGGGSNPDETIMTGQIIAASVLNAGNGTLDLTYDPDVSYAKPPSIQLVK
jgi:hypothetical protein